MPPAFVTLMGPDVAVAVAGTVTRICVSDLTVKRAPLLPLNFTAMAPVKVLPERVTSEPLLPWPGTDVTAGGTLKDVVLRPDLH